MQVVIHADDSSLYQQAIKGIRDDRRILLDPIIGGASRQESVRRGLEALKQHPMDHVLIHDSARPFVSATIIQKVIDALDHAPGVIASAPMPDSIIRVEKGTMRGMIDRENLRRSFTPQGFRFSAIYDAHRATKRRDYTDDSGLALDAGLTIVALEDSDDNWKITTDADIRRAQHMIDSHFPSIRVGNGFDVHRLVDGTGMKLCGVPIDHPQRLSGHSDADVGLHALTDAILGALGKGDIGVHFPPQEERWKGADSRIFLDFAREEAERCPARIEHIDLTFICEFPKLTPYRQRMIERLSEWLKIEPSRVSVKATTSEKMGFTGRGEGIAALASATLAVLGARP